MEPDISGHVPVAIGTDKDIQSFLRELDVPFLCIIGATIGSKADNSSPMESDAPCSIPYVFNSFPPALVQLDYAALHYTLPKAVLTLPLPGVLRPFCQSGKWKRFSLGRPRETADQGLARLLDSSIGLVELPDGPRQDSQSVRQVLRLKMNETQHSTSKSHKSKDWSNSSHNSITRAFLQDIPALRIFLARFLTDAHFTYSSDSSCIYPGWTSPSRRETSDNFSPTQAASRRLSSVQVPLTIEQRLRSGNYALDLDPQGHGIRIHVRRPHVSTAQPPRPSTSKLRGKASARIAPDPIVAENVHAGEEKSPEYSTFLLRPSFDKGSRLVCMITTVGETNSPRVAIHALPLTCTPEDIVSLTQMSFRVHHRQARSPASWRELLGRCLQLSKGSIQPEEGILPQIIRTERAVEIPSAALHKCQQEPATTVGLLRDDPANGSSASLCLSPRLVPTQGTSPSPATLAIAPDLVARHRLLESETFCKALWQSLSGQDHSMHSFARKLYCTIFPTDMPLLRLIGSDSLQLQASDIAKELHQLSPSPLRAYSPACMLVLGQLSGLTDKTVRILCRTMWATAAAEVSSVKLLMGMRQLLNLVPIILEACLSCDGLQKAADLCRLALGYQPEENALHQRLWHLFEKQRTEDRASLSGLYVDEETSEMLLNFVLEFEEQVLQDGYDSDDENMGTFEEQELQSTRESEPVHSGELYPRADGRTSPYSSIRSEKSHVLLRTMSSEDSNTHEQARAVVSRSRRARESLTSRPLPGQFHAHGEQAAPDSSPGNCASVRVEFPLQAPAHLSSTGGLLLLSGPKDVSGNRARTAFAGRKTSRSSSRAFPSEAVDSSSQALSSSRRYQSSCQTHLQHSEGSPAKSSLAAGSSRSHDSDETELVGIDSPSQEPALVSNRTRAGLAVVHIPRLSIQSPMRDQLEATTGPTSAAASCRSGRYGQALSPFTTRSSRRYQGRRSFCQTTEPLAGVRGALTLRMDASFARPPASRSASIISSRSTIDMRRSSTTQSGAPNLAATIDYPCPDSAGAAGDSCQSRLASLARRLGQSYLAIDLWAIIESRRRTWAQALDASELMREAQALRFTSRNLKPRQYTGAGAGLSADMQMREQACSCIALDRSAAPWLKVRPAALVAWTGDIAIVRDLIKPSMLSQSRCRFEQTDSYKPSTHRSDHPISKSESAPAAIPCVQGIGFQHHSSEALLLLRDMLALPPVGTVWVSTEASSSVIGLLADILCQDARHSPNAFESSSRNYSSLQQINDALLAQVSKRPSYIHYRSHTAEPTAAPSVVDPDLLIKCLEARLLELQSIYDRIRAHQSFESQLNAATSDHESDSAQRVCLILRCRLVLIQRSVAAERLTVARALQIYLHGFKPSMHQDIRQHMYRQCSLAKSVLSLVSKVFSCLHICDSRLRSKIGTQTPIAIGLEEAGLIHHLLGAFDLVLNDCIRHPSVGLRLLDEVQGAPTYFECIKECLQAAVFQLKAAQGTNQRVLAFVGDGSKNEVAFCTTTALMRIRLSIISHLNKFLDLCRSILCYYRERQGNFGRTTDHQRGHLRSVCSFIYRTNLHITLEPGATSAVLNMSRLQFEPDQELADQDHQSSVALLWVLGKVIVLDGNRAWVDEVILHHFTSFLKFYATAGDDGDSLVLCKLHLRILLSLASSGSVSVLNKCFQLRILSFLIHEVSAEMQLQGNGGHASTTRFLAPTMSPKRLSLESKDASPRLPTTWRDQPLTAVQPPVLLPCAGEPATWSTKPTKPASVLQVNDEVQGLVTLKSGRQRWFPAKVTRTYEDGWCDLLYEDGDQAQAKPAAEIRLTQKHSSVPTFLPTITSVPPSPLVPRDSEAPHKISAASLPSAVSTEPAAALLAYKVDDRVEGLVTLKSGRQRWFPGKVTSVNLDGTCNLLYDDGDISIATAASDMRPHHHRSYIPHTGAAAHPSLPSAGPAATFSLHSAQASVPCALLSQISAPAPAASQPVVPNPQDSLPVNVAGRSGNPPNMHSVELSLKSAGSPETTFNLRQLISPASILGGSINTPQAGPVEQDDDELSSDGSDCFDIIPNPILRRSSRAHGETKKLQIPEKGLSFFTCKTQQSLSIHSQAMQAEMEEGAVPQLAIATAARTYRLLGSPRMLNVTPETALSEAESSAESVALAAYRAQRNRVVLYADLQLQELVILLLLNLCISADRTTLDSRYCTAFHAQRDVSSDSVSNPLFALYCHLTHPDNDELIPALQRHISQFGEAVHRLFRLLCDGLLDTRLYPLATAKPLASGAFGTVLAMRSPVALSLQQSSYDSGRSHDSSRDLTIKLVKHESTPTDRCVTFDVFSEISALELLSYSPHVCHLYDYGVSRDRFWLVMERCRFSLKAWRHVDMPAQPGDADAMLYLHVFGRVLDAVQTLHDNKIAHFDLKCDNIFIRDIEDNGPDDLPTFQICIGDFGEAQVGGAHRAVGSDLDEEECEEQERQSLMQARGTEAVQSPEMLQIVARTRPDGAGYDRRKRIQVGCASDVWSLGCLLFELMTDDWLFNNSDWSEFFVQLTTCTVQLPPPERLVSLKQSVCTQITDVVERLLEYMLVRDAERRPRTEHVRRQLQLGLQAIDCRLPSHLRRDWDRAQAQHLRDRHRNTALNANSTAMFPYVAAPTQLESLWGFNSAQPAKDAAKAEGLWRLATDAFVGVVRDWSVFFRCPFDVSSVMPERRTDSTHSCDLDISQLTFSGRQLPDIYCERPWSEQQYVTAAQIGIRRVLIVLMEKQHQVDDNKRGPALRCSRMLLSEVEAMTAGYDGQDIDEAATQFAHSRSSHTAAAPAPEAAANSPCDDSVKSVKTPDGQFALDSMIMVLRVATSSQADLFRALGNDSVWEALQHAVEYCLGHSISSKGGGRSSEPGAWVVISPGAGESPDATLGSAGQEGACVQSLVTAVTTMCILYGSSPTSLISSYSAILKVKASYPHACYNPELVDLIHRHAR